MEQVKIAYLKYGKGKAVSRGYSQTGRDLMDINKPLNQPLTHCFLRYNLNELFTGNSLVLLDWEERSLVLYILECVSSTLDNVNIGLSFA